MKKLSIIFSILSLILSHIMVWHITYSYCSLKEIQNSAPQSVAFFLIIPYGIGIICSVFGAIIFYKKSISQNKN